MRATNPKPKREQTGRRTGTDDGFTLLAVVAVVFLLSLVVVTLMRSASALMVTARSLEERAVAENLADGIARLTARHLAINALEATKSGRLPTSGIPAFCGQSGASVTIEVSLVAGHVDLNAASEALLLHVLKGAGLGAEKAAEIAADIVDYRSPGDASLTGASELSRYVAHGRTFGPKNAPFASVQELDQLPGMTRDLYGLLMPLFTVRSGLRYVDPLKAPVPVVWALNGIPISNPTALSDGDLIRLRQETVLPPEFRVPSKTRSERSKSTPAFTIGVTVRTAGGGNFKRTMTATIDAGTGEPATVLEWSEGDPTSAARAPQGGPGAACLGELLWVTK